LSDKERKIMSNGAEYEETFSAFVDFLGFSEASRELDDQMRLKVLELLRALVGLRSEFSATAQKGPDGSTTYSVKPAISTFSDHIVISFGLKSLQETLRTDDKQMLALLVFGQFVDLVSAIAAQALRLGFLIRGGATIGKLYHAEGVVFGEALVEATTLEAHTAVYPRIILSPKAAHFQDMKYPFIKLEDDGIYCVDYIQSIMRKAAIPGEQWAANVKRWFDEVVPVVQAALDAHAQNGRLNELAKWTWFAKRFRSMIEALPQQGRATIGVSLDAIPWGK
jgi:hypothetical protein